MPTLTYRATLLFETRLRAVDRWTQECLADVRERGKRPLSLSLSPPLSSLIDPRAGDVEKPVRFKGGPVYAREIDWTLRVEVE